MKSKGFVIAMLVLVTSRPAQATAIREVAGMPIIQNPNHAYIAALSVSVSVSMCNAIDHKIMSGLLALVFSRIECRCRTSSV